MNEKPIDTKMCKKIWKNSIKMSYESNIEKWEISFLSQKHLNTTMEHENIV